MIRRPLNPRFITVLLAGVKTSTIRDSPWPVGKPIMLFQWTGKPYRSKQADIAAVIVKSARKMEIAHHPEDGRMTFSGEYYFTTPLHECEGFESRADLEAWFRPLIKRGSCPMKWFMRFELFAPGGEARP